MLYQERLIAFQKILTANQCPAFIIDDKTSLFYLTGLELSAGRLLVETNGATLFVDNRYFELCQKHSPFPVVLVKTSSFQEVLESQAYKHFCQIGFDSTHTSFSSAAKLQAIGAPLNISFTPIEDPISALRLIKDENECHLLQAAANLGSAGYDYVVSLLEVGISEKELALELEIFWQRNGAKGVAFDPIIAFGANSSMPHFRASDRRLKLGDIVLIDIGVNKENYHSDMTRTIFFGDPHPQLLDIYTVVKNAQQMALDVCRPGAKIEALDAAARDYISTKGYGEFFTHSLGHGIGLHVHEAPWIRKIESADHVLLPKMALTIEPGIYIPGLGGVRIEDSVIIEENGHLNLTKRSKEITVIKGRKG